MVERISHFLLVIRLGRFTEEERATPKWIQENFGEEALQFSTVLFTGEDELRTPMEEFLRESSGLQTLINSFGGGYHLFNNKDKKNRAQVTGLLEKIEAVLVSRSGYHLAPMRIQQSERMIQTGEERKRKELEGEREKLKREIRAEEQREREKLEREREQLEREIRAEKRMRQKLEREREELEREREELEREIRTGRRTRKKLEREREELERDREELESEIRAEKRIWKKLEREREELDREIREKNEEEAGERGGAREGGRS